ncbi:TPA: hypothetical protein ACH3X2_012275 [Trebouxia sp. C0005]
MWDIVADNPEMQQHLVSHLNRAKGDLAKTQASHQNGSAHPTATLSRVRDTWGHLHCQEKGLLARRWLSKVKAQQKHSSQKQDRQALLNQRLSHSARQKPQEQSWDQGSRSRLQQLRLLKRRTAQQRHSNVCC